MRKFLGLMLATALLLPLGVIGASSASAGAPVLTCKGLTGTVTWKPPVSPTKKQISNVHATGKITGCTGTKGITGGSFVFDVKGKTAQNCHDLITSKKASIATTTITWSNTKKSTSPKVTVTPSPTPTEIVKGTVSSGTQFLHKVVQVSTLFLPKNGGCVSKGKSLASASVSISKGKKLTVS